MQVSDKLVRLRETLKTRIRAAAPDFEARWQTLLTDFREWESSPAGQSSAQLSLQLELLRRLCATFPDAELRKAPDVVWQVVSDAKPVGDFLTLPLPEGRLTKAMIVHREVNEHFEIRYTLEGPDGSRFGKTFAD